MAAAAKLRTTGGRASGPLFAAFVALATAPAPGAAVAQTPPDTLYPLPEIDGALSWDILAGVDVGVAADGEGVAVAWADDVLALDGETVKMVGFLLPLGGDGRRQLLSRNSPNCPFCLPGGPEGFVELLCDEPIDYTMDAVVVAGVFELLRSGGDGYFYRMTDVEQLDE